MQRAGLQGISGRKKWRRIKPDTVATDLVERDFDRNGPNQLWVTDITERPIREGKVYCCVVLDTYSRPTDRPALHRRLWPGRESPSP